MVTWLDVCEVWVAGMSSPLTFHWCHSSTSCRETWRTHIAPKAHRLARWRPFTRCIHQLIWHGHRIVFIRVRTRGKCLEKSLCFVDFTIHIHSSLFQLWQHKLHIPTSGTLPSSTIVSNSWSMRLDKKSSTSCLSGADGWNRCCWVSN